MANNIFTGNGLKMGHVNTRSLLKHQHEIFLYMRGTDVLGVSETWLKPIMNDAMIYENGYAIVRQDRNVIYGDNIKKHGGGLLFYVKEEMSTYVTKLNTQCGCTCDMEQLWISIDKPAHKKLVVGLIYRPPDGDVETFITSLKHSYDTLNLNVRCTPDVVILGDFNIDYSKKRDRFYKKLREFETSSTLKQVIRDFTRITNKSKSMIDLIFTNIIDIKASGTLSVTIADHLPIYIIKKKSKEKSKKVIVKKRNYKTYNAVDFTNLIESDWRWANYWAITGDPTRLWNLIVTIFMDAADTLYPIRTVISQRGTPNWMNDYLLSRITQKNSAYLRAVKNGTEKDWEIFKRLKKETRKLLIKHRRLFVTNKLGSLNKDPKKFWREMGENLNIGKYAPKGKLIGIRDEEGTLREGKDAANFMNKYYTEIGHKLAECFKENWAPSSFFDILNTRKFEFNFVTENTVKSVLLNMPLNKTSCIEFLSTRLLRDGMLRMLTETTYLMNQCLSCDLLPDSWKVGYVTPMPKGGSLSNPGDWRPVSVLPMPSKVIERIVYNQLAYHFETNCYLFKNQHGFRQGRSTSTAIFEYVTHLYEALDRQEYTSSIFVDYSRAFDTINHEVLLKKLKLYNLDDKSCNWFKNYLFNRSQVVKLDAQCLSTVRPITMGVPQGSILGPLLFVIYINDLVYELYNCDSSVTLYADDTILYSSHTDMYMASAMNQSTVNILYDWCQLNRLSINLGKTKHMIVYKDKIDSHDQPIVKVKNSSLDNVYSYNYLGVIIDDMLSFDKFVEDKYNKANFRIYQLSKIRKYITVPIAEVIYKQMILPLFDYADFMVESSGKTIVERLEKLQERAVMYIDNNRSNGMEVARLYDKYGIQPLVLRRREHHSCIMYILSKKNVNLEIARPSINLRSNSKIHFKKRKRRKYEKYLKSPLVRGVKLWEMLPEKVQKATTKVKFKSFVKQICKT